MSKPMLLDPAFRAKIGLRPLGKPILILVLPEQFIYCDACCMNKKSKAVLENDYLTCLSCYGPVDKLERTVGGTI